MPGRRNIGFSYPLSLRERARARVRGFFSFPRAAWERSLTAPAVTKLSVLCRYRDECFKVGSRTDSRDTFFCVAKRKYPKKRQPGCRVNPALLGFEQGFPKGHPSPYEKRDASLHRPDGLIRSNPPVLGAARRE